jgi:O-antigen/teichoic acid export membrane protein
VINVILKSSSWLLAFRMLGAGAVFCMTTLLANNLDIDDFGKYGAFINYANYLTLICGVGLPLAYIYSSENKNYKNVNLILSSALVYIVMLPLAYGMLVVFKQDNSLGGFLVLFVFLQMIFNLLLSIHNKKEHFILYGFYNLIFPSVVLVVFAALPLFLEWRYVTVEYLFIVHIAVISTLNIVLIVELKLCKHWAFKGQVVVLSGEYLSYGAKAVSSNIMAAGLYTIDIAFLGYMKNNSDVGVYIIAGTIVKLAWLVSDSMGMVIFPKIVKDKSSSTLMVRLLSSYSFVINLTGVVLFFLFGEIAISFVFGDEYRAAYAPALLLLVGSHGITIYKLLGRYFAAHNNWKAIYIPLAIALSVNIILNIVLIPEYSYYGAAMASLIAYWACGIGVILFTADRDFLGYVKSFSSLEVTRDG